MKKILVTLLGVLLLNLTPSFVYATGVNKTYELGTIPLVAIEGYHFNWETNEFKAPASRLGHLAWWADLCFYRPGNGFKHIRELKVDFYARAIPRDRARFRTTSTTRTSNAPHYGIRCQEDVAADIYAVFSDVIRWLEENPGSSVPKLSEFFDAKSSVQNEAGLRAAQQSNEQQIPARENDPLAKAKATCSDSGFTSGTEKHGNCVLKIASNSGSEVTPAANEPETASNDNKPPTITIASASSNGPVGTVSGLVTCERYQDNELDFFRLKKTGSYYRNLTYESLFPKELEIEVRSFERVPGRSALISKNQTLLESGKLIIQHTELWPRHNFARYQCDKTSIEVAALLDKLEKQPVTEVVEQQTPTQENDPFAEAKAFCSDLGFTSGTEKHGNCVLKIASNSGSEVAPATNEPETASNENKPPEITIASASSNGPEGTVKGRVTDEDGIAEVRVDGQVVQTDSDGNFTASTYVPKGGVSVFVKAVNLAGLSSSMSVKLKRSASNTVASISFERLNPLGRKVAKNKDALALIIGVDGYSKIPARAIYADSDAEVFADYASQKLGISTNRIKTLVNDGADVTGMLLAVKRWLARASKQGKSDVYIFFAGHGLASDNGEKMYLLPYDGSPELLEKTAILRQELFDDIASANPRSVTVFLDTCYSGTTRGTDMLIASRPIAIKALEQSIPDNFTVMTAARGDQTAKPLQEAKHGMFSYFLMKGMEGEADANNDNKITAGELHSYVQQNVVQQSSGSQTPELQGDAERVLVRFQ